MLAEQLGDVYADIYSPGLFFPNYLYGLAQISQGQSTGRNLLLGALTPRSIEEYKEMLENVSPGSSLVVIDNEGFPTKNSVASYTSQIQLPDVHFVFADALQQSFQGGSFDTVGSNGLFHYLTEREEAGQKVSEEDMKKRLLKGISRMLRPGGVYVGVEPYKRINPVDYLEAGFSEIIQHPPLMVASRQHLDDFLRNPKIGKWKLKKQMRQGKLAYEPDLELVVAKK